MKTFLPEVGISLVVQFSRLIMIWPAQIFMYGAYIYLEPEVLYAMLTGLHKDKWRSLEFKTD